MSEFVGRVSTDKSDVGYSNFERGRVFVVRLDGVEQKNVMTADSIKGEVVRCKLDSHGEIYMDGGVIALETVTGTVKIEVRD